MIPPLVREVLNAEEHAAIKDLHWPWYSPQDFFSKKTCLVAKEKAKIEISKLLKSRLPKD